MTKNKGTIFLQLLLIVGFNITYYFIISDVYSYMGFSATFQLSKFFVISFLTICLLLYSSVIQNEFISIVWFIFFNLFYLGESIYFQYSSTNHWEVLMGIVLFLFLLPLVSFNKKRLITVRFENQSLLPLVLLAIIMFIPIFITSYKYINFKNLLLIDVYETRSTFRDISMPIIAYIKAPLVRILVPYIIIKSIETKKYAYTVIGTIIILFVYLGGALKSIFIGLLAVFFFYKGSYLFKKRLFITILLIFNYLGLVMYYVFNNVFLLDSFVRRVFFTPAYLNSIYIEYFKDNFTYFSHSPLGLGLSPDKFGKPLSYFIGENILNKPGLNANVGLFTEGYVSFGIGGVIFMVVILLFIFQYLNAIQLTPSFFGLVFVYIYYMNTAFLSVLLLTHGLFLFLVFAYFYLNSNGQASETLGDTSV